ncbi:unnamed protein product [Blepharisma stoltei]|uniref:Uncharacterized protein n=1 Tax=Blepharisma stoltei TaxID=1481888 RepID=A0AAU9IJM7_9CILI|nr:unnamed protein product [Blepharisma stoltei]
MGCCISRNSDKIITNKNYNQSENSTLSEKLHIVLRNKTKKLFFKFSILKTYKKKSGFAKLRKYFSLFIIID